MRKYFIEEVDEFSDELLTSVVRCECNFDPLKI